MKTTERGQVLPFVAICLTVLMGFAGFAIDFGYLQYQQRQQQTAADAAAIAGAQALITNNTCPDNSAALSAAETDASANGFTNGVNGVSITAQTPASGPFSSDNCAVQATITSPHLTWFSKVFGFKGTMTTTAIAVVESQSQGGGCLYVLGGGMTASAIDIDTPNCGVVINGSVTSSGSSFDTDYFGYSGSLTQSGDTFTGASPAPMLPVANPCTDISGCNDLTNNPPATSPCNAGPVQAGGTLALTPGCYGAMVLSGVNVTLSPGLYVLNGITGSGVTFTGSGVTIYEATGGFTASGSGNSLSACTTSCTNGAVSGVLLFQPTSNSSGVTISGTSSNYSGLVYAPSAAVTASGAGTGYVIYVVSTMTVSGSDFTDTPPTPGPGVGPTPGGLFIKNPVLAY